MSHYDLIVCGGGPAGSAAAIAAGRRGLKTLLVERYTHLGGMATGARVYSFCDSPGGPLYDEVLERLRLLDALTLRENRERFRPPGRYRYQPEMLKLVLMEMVLEAGVEVLLDTVACGVLLEAARVTGIRIANKAGLQALQASVVIDATADADIACAAGVPTLQGDPADGRIQHCNYRWQLGGVDAERYAAEKPARAQLRARLRAAHREGRLRAPTALFGMDPGLFPWDETSGQFRLGSWELQHVDPTDPLQCSRTVAECQAIALQVIRFCRAELPGFEACRVEALPAALGTRESRRIVGRHQVTGADVLAGTKYEDAIARGWFWIDLHDPPPGRSTPYTLEYVKTHQPPPGDWYEISYRCLLPRNVSGLLAAGRCISCDREALGSLRVMPTCMYTGTAAGLAAAMACEQGLAPHAIDGRAVHREILGR